MLHTLNSQRGDLFYGYGLQFLENRVIFSIKHTVLLCQRVLNKLKNESTTKGVETCCYQGHRLSTQRALLLSHGFHRLVDTVEIQLFLKNNEWPAVPILENYRE